MLSALRCVRPRPLPANSFVFAAAARAQRPTTTIHVPSIIRQTAWYSTRPKTPFTPGPSTKALLFKPPARFFSSNNAPGHTLPVLSPPSVAMWLLSSATLVFGIMVVGAVTRLTESGLSITEWKPITGIVPPLTKAQWEEEFDKYKQTPEFKLLKHTFTLDEFKSIFFWEWGHRVLGRVLGVTFLVPLGYFALRKKLTPGLGSRLSFYTLLIGAQGAMGWYMVKSGLEDEIMTTPGAVPRVSQYRLASHLTLAFILYIGMFSSGLNAIKDWKYAHGRGVELPKSMFANPIVKRFRLQALTVTGLVLLTAISGAFVAGLDAGLVYNEWPLMGGRIAPPSDELFSTSYAKSPNHSDLYWRNMLENPTTVQFDHRMLALTTYFSTAYLFARTWFAKGAFKAALPPLTRMTTAVAFAMANVQVALGISTLLFLVPVPLAACHQAGSVMLLSTMVHVLISLRRPGTVARLWRKFNLQQAGAATATTTTAAGVKNAAGAEGLQAAKAAMKNAAAEAAKKV